MGNSVDPDEPVLDFLGRMKYSFQTSLSKNRKIPDFIFIPDTLPAGRILFQVAFSYLCDECLEGVPDIKLFHQSSR